MYKLWAIIMMTALWMPITGYAEEVKELSPADRVNKRQKTEIAGFFLNNAKNASLPQTPFAVELYNEAVTYFQSRDYDLAEESLRESIAYDPRNPFSPELLGDIYYLKHNIAEAKEYYKQAYLLRPGKELKEKIEKINREQPLEESFETLDDEKFILKYQGSRGRFGAEKIREFLDETYRSLSREFGHSFKRPLVVLLYDEAEFRRIMDVPHWIGGFYDGKVRLPAYGFGFLEKNLRAVMAHEMTHAFVADLARGNAPAWINEGLAEYEERKIHAEETIVLDAAIRTQTLLSLDQLMVETKAASDLDPLYANLFYEQSYSVMSYLIRQHGMFKIREILASFGEGKDSEEALTEVIGMKITDLELIWKETLPEI
jgi:tetratricopeptide (TPR) repeat protein